jgi:bifunctional non-homologous end joining protein LigD
VYLDFLQNRRGQTLAAAYSVRPWPGATVSTPLKWSEVGSRLDPARYTIRTLPKRLAKVGDLWQGVLGKGADLPASLDALRKEMRDTES